MACDMVTPTKAGVFSKSISVIVLVQFLAKIAYLAHVSFLIFGLCKMVGVLSVLWSVAEWNSRHLTSQKARAMKTRLCYNLRSLLKIHPLRELILQHRPLSYSIVVSIFKEWISEWFRGFSTVRSHPAKTAIPNDLYVSLWFTIFLRIKAIFSWRGSSLGQWSLQPMRLIQPNIPSSSPMSS